jgi:hypothetical protein
MAHRGGSGLRSGTSCAPEHGDAASATRRTHRAPSAPNGADEVNSIATRHRAGLTTAVALATVLVIAGLLVGSPTIERVIPRLPDVRGDLAALGLAGLALGMGLVALLVRSVSSARTRARRTALESVYTGEVTCGIRNRGLTDGLEELREHGARPIALSSRFSVVADAAGISFWTGGRRPRRAAMFTWREVRNIRSDSTVVGSASVPVAVLRIRRAGASVELPIMLSDSRVSHYALVDAAFYAVVRAWKAQHRAALAAEGIEPPPLTAPIPVIREERPAA